MPPGDRRGRVPAPLRALAAKLRPGSRERGGYEEFRQRVEPALAAHPRVHRFAQPPVIGDHATQAVPLAVAIDTAAGGDADATMESLGAQSVPPAQVVQSPGPPPALDARVGWIVLVPAGDRLAPTALQRLGQAIALAPDAAVVTCDDDRLDRGRRADPRCGPGPSPDALLSANQSGPPVALALERMAAAPAGGPARDLELLVAMAGADGAGHAHVPMFLFHRAPRPDTDGEAQASAVARALAARGEGGTRVEAVGPGRRRVRRPLSGEPLVEAIVCFRDRPRLLERCARSLLESSGYERLSLRLVDNGSREALTAELLARLERDPRVTLARDDSPFNFAALNNRAAAASGADFLVFLNSDTEVVEPGWIERLLEEAQRPEVGAVAPLLLYPEGTVQHVGAALGLHGFAGHPFAGLAPDARSPFGAAGDGTRNWLAVTAACLMVERRKFDAVGAFDESFAVGGNDVELCLRLTESGHRSLCVPDVRLLHSEYGTRHPTDIPAGDFERSRQRYGAFRTLGDPFYNPNLTLADTTCALRSPAEPLP